MITPPPHNGLVCFARMDLLYIKKYILFVIYPKYNELSVARYLYGGLVIHISLNPGQNRTFRGYSMATDACRLQMSYVL